jgi:hypothetical protein
MIEEARMMKFTSTGVGGEQYPWLMIAHLFKSFYSRFTLGSCNIYSCTLSRPCSNSLNVNVEHVLSKSLPLHPDSGNAVLGSRVVGAIFYILYSSQALYRKFSYRSWKHMSGRGTKVRSSSCTRYF